MKRFRARRLNFSPDSTSPRSDFDDSIIETERSDLLALLSTFFSSWQNLWQGTKTQLIHLNLSESGTRRVNFYESEQRKSILTLLAELFVLEDTRTPSNTPDGTTFATNFAPLVLSLAKELRPSLAYAEYDPSENFTLDKSSLFFLRLYLKNASALLKTLVSDLEKFRTKRLDLTPAASGAPDFQPISVDSARRLLENSLGLSNFDFIDFDSNPTFKNGYFPALLQASADFDL